MLYLFAMALFLALGLSWIISGLDNGVKSSIVKGIFITVLMYLSLCIFFSFESVKGWPTNQDLPERFVLKSVVIEEPNKRTRAPGGIYLWVIPKKYVNTCPPGVICIKPQSTKMPRSFRVEYTKEKHEQMLEAMKRIAEGETIVVEMQKGDKQRGRDHSPERDQMRFYDLPDLLDELRKD